MEFLNSIGWGDQLRSETLPRRTVLLVDDEPNTLSALRRVFRKEDYEVLTAESGAEGLARLEHQAVGVIVSDQRMPKMTGVEFLREVKRRYPDTVRIVLSGYTDLQSVTAAINEGAIYKFLTKPWDDELLRADVREAFGIYELRWENRRLARELKEANEALARFNLELEKRVEEKARHLQLNAASLKLSQELLNLLPVAVIGIDNDGMIVFANQLAHRLLDDSPSLLERPLQAILPQVAAALRHADDGWLAQPILLADACWARVSVQSLGQAPQTRGRLITLVMNEEA